MSKCYECDLQKGDRVVISDNLLVSKEGDRMREAIVWGKTDAGVVIRIRFDVPCFAEDRDPEKWSYNLFVDYAALYCGRVALHKMNGEQVRVKCLREDMSDEG